MISQRHLATVYRPQRFSEVVGQDLICKILSSSASSGDIASGYIFSGIRGVGKTTVARIFAKAINCENAPTPEPCNDCRFCKQITKGVCIDVLEIDGASHTGVDNIRKLNEDISHRPVECKYRVIIIDEAHMLSKSAFNALLKTLEEPPGYVTFIFATTEPYRFPSTIISRCHHFVFKRIPTGKIVEYLEDILKKENIRYQKEALELIARKSEGSLRDSLSMLSQVVAISSDVNEKVVKEILGIADRDRLYNLIRAIKYREIESLLKETDELMEAGIDISHFLQEFSSIWRDLFIVKTSNKDVSKVLNLSEDEVTKLEELSFGLSIQHIHSAWQMSLTQQRNILSSPDPSISLQLLLLNIAYLTDLLPIEEIKTQSSKAIQKETKERKDWDGFLKFLKKTKAYGEFPNIQLVNVRINENLITLRCPGYLADRLMEKNRFSKLKELIEKYFEKNMAIKILKEHSDLINDKEKAKREIVKHPGIKNIIEEFNAEIESIYWNHTNFKE